MKRQYTFLFFLISLWMVAQENIIPNGGFEQYSAGRPVGWYFGSYLGFSRDRDAHSGRYSAKVWANGDSFITSKGGEYNVADVQENSEYQISYWHKGNIPKENVVVSVYWYKDDQRIKTEVLENEQVLTSETEWKKKEITVNSPIGVNKVGLEFRLKLQEGYILIDDISMVFVKKNDNVKLPMPTGITTKSHQREIEFFWDKEADDTIEWEVQVNNETPHRTKNNAFVVEQLELRTSYSLKVRAVKGEQYSDFTPAISVSTVGMNHSEDSVERVPHLRTLGTDGETPQSLRLYYYDLATPNTIIRYFVDETEIKPTDGVLTFSKKGKQKLKLIIEETPERQWEIEYDIEVK